MARMIVSMVILGSNPSNGDEQRHGKHRCDPLHQRHFMPPQRTLTVGPWLGNSSRHGDTSRWLLRHPSEGEAAPDQAEDAGEKAAHADQQVERGGDQDHDAPGCGGGGAYVEADRT